MRKIMSLVMWSLLAWGLLFSAFWCVTSCSQKGKNKTVYTSETILEAADVAWDTAYHVKLEACKAKYAPRTPEAEACFGPWYDADAKVRNVMGKVADVLVEYWSARKRGEKPSWPTVAAKVIALLQELPPEAAGYFEDVKGF